MPEKRLRYSMPPAQVVSRVLHDVKDTYTSIDGFFFPVRPYEEMVSCCKEIYSNSDNFSTVSKIVVNGNLCYIFRYYCLNLTLQEPRRDDMERYHMMLARNLMVLLRQLPLTMEPSDENAEALLLGLFYAVQTSRLSLCAALASKAANLWFALGYHRIESMANDAPKIRERKILMFWSLYVVDKGLCLRLGRTAAVQDCDINVPLPGCNPAAPDRAMEQMARFWIRLSELQGCVYEYLYSPRAMNGDAEPRAARADALASEIRDMMAERSQLVRKSDEPAHSFERRPLEDEMVLDTTLTSILCPIPRPDRQPLSYSQECVAAARKALELHQAGVAQFGTKVDKHLFCEYLHSTLIHTPFTPFLVIFCHTINNQSTDDLQLLSDFTETLQPVRRLSPSVENLFVVCDAFSRVAKLLMDATRKDPTDSALLTPEVPASFSKVLNSFLLRSGSC